MEFNTDNVTYLLESKTKKIPSITYFKSYTRRDF